MIDLHLRAGDEDELKIALSFARRGDAWIEATHDFALNIIGILYTESVYDEQGEVLTPAVPLEGYHANMRCKEWIRDFIPENIIITVNNPQIIWA